MRFFKTIPLMLLVAVAASGCNSDSARNLINSQYAADYNAKAMELNDAVGVWTGSMHLLSQDQDFDCVITLRVVPENEKSPQAESPSETARIATLGGNITFPALVNLPLQDYPGFQQLLNPLNDLAIVNVSFGDYQRSDQSFVLPYLDSKQNPFGDLTGTVDGDTMTGTWFANDFGDVGTFVLYRKPNSAPISAVGGTSR